MARVRVLVPAETEPKVIERVAPPEPAPQPVQPQAAPQPTVPQQSQPVAPVAPIAPAAPSSAVSEPPKKGIHLSRRAILFILASFIVVVMVAVALARNVGHPQTLNGTDTSGKSEAEQYHDKVTLLVELSVDELPTVANVSDAEKTKKENAALADVKNGDKYLLFVKSHKLVIYRPDTNKVVTVISIATQPKN